MVIINLLLNNAGNTPYTRPITQKHRFRSKSFCRRGKNIPHVMWHIITFRRWAISPRWSNMKNMENNIDFLDIFIYCVILCPTHLLDWNYLTTKFSQWVIPLYKYQFDYIGCVGDVYGWTRVLTIILAIWNIQTKHILTFYMHVLNYPTFLYRHLWKLHIASGSYLILQKYFCIIQFEPNCMRL